MNRSARIVATLGPSSSEDATVQSLIEAGMDVARLNFSHGTHEEHAVRIAQLRRLSDQLGKPVTILQDLQGPKLRIGVLPQGTIQLKAGQIVNLTIAESLLATPGEQEQITIPFDVRAVTSLWMMGTWNWK
jgi:pyruvate kinase